MKKLIVAVILCAASLCLMGCGDDDESFDNVSACKNWLASMKCGTYDFSTLVKCDSYSGVTTCNIAAYFDCLTAEYKCTTVGGVSTPDMSGWTKCTDKAKCS